MRAPGRLYQMYSAEPLPHFVDEYLAYLYEAHPTNATFDGVHLHDDLLEDLGRQAIDAQIRDLGGFARRLAAIDPARLTDTERLERPALERTSARGCSSSNRSGPGSGARSTTPTILATSLAGQVLFDYAPLAERARRVLLEAPPGPAADPVGARQHQGSARHLRQGRAREPARHAAIHRRRSAARVRRSGRPAPARRSGGRLDRGGHRHRRPTSSTSRRTWRRAARARSGWAARSSSRSSSSTKASRSAPIGCSSIAMRELQATQEEFRRVASRLNGGDPDGRLAARQAGSSRRRAARPGRAAAARGARRTSSSASGSSRIPEGAPVAVLPTPRFYRWTSASMWTPGPVRECARSAPSTTSPTSIRRGRPSARPSICATSATARSGRSRCTRSSRGTSSTTSTSGRSTRSCASRCCSRRRRSSKAGRTTASR